MKTLMFCSLILLSSFVYYAYCVFLTPSILEPPKANKIVCMDLRIEEAGLNGNQQGLFTGGQAPYLACINNAIIKVVAANLVLSVPQVCPLQFVNIVDTTRLPHCEPANIINSDITDVFKSLCETKGECHFSFTQLPRLLCLTPPENANANQANVNANNPEITQLPLRFTAVNVTYGCQLPRRRFRPFSDKRYNLKFTRTINHPIRKMSYNRLMSL